jgi:hypothetical protein
MVLCAKALVIFKLHPSPACSPVLSLDFLSLFFVIELASERKRRKDWVKSL